MEFSRNIKINISDFDGEKSRFLYFSLLVNIVFMLRASVIEFFYLREIFSKLIFQP